jgi:regulator of protease activity HflC (stomatin/prohibitin superfamily)
MELAIVLLAIGAFAIFLGCSLRVIPSNPPHIAVVTFLGQRTPVIKEEGLRLFPFWPAYKGILVSMVKETQQFSPQRLLDKQHNEMEVVLSVSWTPDKNNAVTFLDNGGREGVKEMLESILTERIRNWTATKTWQETVATKDDLALILMRGVTELDDKESANLGRKVQTGASICPVQSLGIILNRLNICEVRLSGELLRDAGLSAREERQRDAERIEMSHVRKLVKDICAELGCSTEEAIELTQTERGKVSKKISQIKGSVSGETLAAVLRILNR